MWNYLYQHILRARILRKPLKPVDFASLPGLYAMAVILSSLCFILWGGQVCDVETLQVGMFQEIPF